MDLDKFAGNYARLENIALAARSRGRDGAPTDQMPLRAQYGKAANLFCASGDSGGAKRGAENEMLTEIKRAVDEGVSGVAIGRNIWQFENPAAMTRAAPAILHEGATVEAAMKLLKSWRHSTLFLTQRKRAATTKLRLSRAHRTRYHAAA